MIAWEAFVDYFVSSGEKAKTFLIVFVVVSLFLRKIDWLGYVGQQFSRLSAQRWLTLILSVGLLLRLSWILWSPHIAPSANTEDYKILYHARNLINGLGFITIHGTPTAVRPIGYALYVAGVFKLLGENMLVVELTQALFQTLTIWIIFRLGAQVKNEACGLIAAGCYAVYPTSIFAAKIILEEHIFIPVWLAGISFLISDFKQPDWRKVAVAGLLFGMSAHFRTYGFAMGLVALFMWLIVKRSCFQGLLRFFLIQALIILWGLPWAIRNYHAFGEPILFTSSIGRALYYSNNPTSDVRWPINPTLEQGGDPEFILAEDEVKQSIAGKRAAFEWIRENPSLFAQKALGRVIYMLGLTREGWTVQDNFNTVAEGRERPPDKLISKLDKMDNDYYAIIFLMALLGFCLFWLSGKWDMRKQAFLYLWVTGAYYLSIVAITLGHRKYRFSLEPLLCLFAGYAVYVLLAARKKPKAANAAIIRI